MRAIEPHRPSAAPLLGVPRPALGWLLAVVTVAGAVAAPGCGKRRRDTPEPAHDAPRARRVIEPPTDRVGPLPPYAIRGDAVGPYKLGEKLADLLEQLASGPRIELFEIAGVVHRNVIRAEDDTILIGGEQASTASFVAVIGGEVARTESGVHVGSTRDELVAALGPPSDLPERARDPRLIVPASMPGLRAVLDGDKVAAIVVASPATPPHSQPECARPAATERAFGACLTAAGEMVYVDGEELVVRSADSERTLVSPTKVPGLLFAAALRVLGEPRDELVVITRSDEASARSWGITAFRLDGTRLVRTVDATQIYQLSSGNARWIGAELRDVELYLELTSRADGIDLGGLLTTRSAPKAATKFRDVVVISPASVPRRRGKPTAAEASDAGVPASAPPRVTQDAAVDALDSPAEPAEVLKP